MSSIGVMIGRRGGRVGRGRWVVGGGVVGLSMVGGRMVGRWGRRIGRGRWLIGGRMMRVWVMWVLGRVDKWVLMWVFVQLVQGHSFATVNLIPEFTGKLVLIEQGAVGTNKASAGGTVTTIVTHTVHLTTSLRISIHARLERSTGTAKLGVGSLSITGIVNTSLARNTMLIMVLMMVRILVGSMVGSGLMVSWFWGMIGSWLMVCGLRSMVRSWLMISRSRRVIGSWLMISRSRGTVGSRLMVSWGRRTVGSRLMISRCRGTVRSWLMVSWGRRAVGSRLMISRCRGTVRSWSWGRIRSCRSRGDIIYTFGKVCKLWKSFYSGEIFSKLSKL